MRRPNGNPTYALVEVIVTDPVGFDEYVKGHAVTLARYGGTFPVATNRCEVIEGEWRPAILVVRQWPDAAAFHASYGSLEYRPWKEVRHRVASANIVLAEGITNPTGS